MQAHAYIHMLLIFFVNLFMYTVTQSKNTNTPIYEIKQKKIEKITKTRICDSPRSTHNRYRKWVKLFSAGYEIS